MCLQVYLSHRNPGTIICDEQEDRPPSDAGDLCQKEFPQNPVRRFDLIST